MTAVVEIAKSTCHNQFFDMEYSILSNSQCLWKLKKQQKNPSWMCRSHRVAKRGNSVTEALSYCLLSTWLCAEQLGYNTSKMELISSGCCWSRSENSKADVRNEAFPHSPTATPSPEV